jgi:Na+-driven multidrug efflux pump
MLNLLVFWLWEIPLAYALAKVFGMGPNGIYLAIAIAFSTYAIAGRIVFNRGTWKLRKV